MTEITLAEAKRKQNARPEKDPYVGLTDRLCCDDCNVEKCVISGKPYCAHPRKCGLQHTEKHNPKAVKRLQEAASRLLHKDVDKRIVA